MARIKANTESKVLEIDKFLGLNASPYGGTGLKTGELSVCDNFCITPGHHMRLRPGTETMVTLPGEFPRAKGLWTGYIDGKEIALAMADKTCYMLDMDRNTAVRISTFGSSQSANEVHFFAFDNKVYALDGEYLRSWDGNPENQFHFVTPYVPTIQLSTTPSGKGTLLEPPNRLTAKRRVLFSPDGKASTFRLPESGLNKDGTMAQDVEIKSTKVINPDTGEWQSVSVKSFSQATGKLTLNAPPAEGTNTLEVVYSKGTGDAQTVYNMRFAEQFNGATDSRVFLYGDGTNRAIYSGVRYDTGKPSADYFPDLFELRVGEENTPITAMCRHYSQLMAFKPDGAWQIDYGQLGLKDKSIIPAFYIKTVNRKMGNDLMAAGQVSLIENSPVTLSDGVIYRWRSNYFGSYPTGETSAERLSDRVQTILDELNVGGQAAPIVNYHLFNDTRHKELWFLYGGHGDALIFNYEVDAWYRYRFTNGPLYLFEVGGQIYGLTKGCKVLHISHQYRNDDGKPINAYAITGAMDFSRMWQLKYSPEIFVSVQPEKYARVLVSAESNRRSDYPWKPVSYNWATFSNCDFRHWSFVTNRRPQVQRLKLKVKKATYYRLLFKSESDAATCTVLSAAIRLRFAGKVK